MNKKILCLFVFGILILGTGFVVADSDVEEMIVKANVLPESVSISVPDSIILGEVAPGYMTEEIGFDISNTGTVDIQVVPELGTSTDEDMFSHLAFKRIQADELTKIGLFSVDIEKPSSVGGERDQNVYVQLDLTEYEGEVVGSNNATIVFTAVPL